MTDEKDLNFTREAFLHPLNLGLLLASTLSAFFMNGIGIAPDIILSLAFGMELVYLGTVPRSPGFRKSVKIRKLKERKHSFEDKEKFQELSPRNQKKFLVLKHLSRMIKQNFEKLPYTSQGLLGNINEKMDGLLTNYLNLLDLHQRYSDLLYTDTEKQLKEKIEQEKEEVANSVSEKLKNIKSRRLHILTKRLERFTSAKEKFDICETQLETIEDAIRYIYEQSLTMNNPEEIGFQLDNLLSEVEETSSIIQQDIEAVGLPQYNFLETEDVENDHIDESVKSVKRVRE